MDFQLLKHPVVKFGRFNDSLMENWPAFLLGVYQGNLKPANVNDYMEDFVNEILHLQANGFLYRGELIKINIFGFSCIVMYIVYSHKLSQMRSSRKVGGPCRSLANIFSASK